MRIHAKRDFPVSEVRRFLEPGPVVLVSSAWRGRSDIMTMGWHMVMEFEPSLIGCYVWSENYSRDLIRRSKECVINLPTADMAPAVVGIGNTSGGETEKFATFDLTAAPAAKVKVPMIAECFANFECKLVDTSLIRKYGLFVFQVVKAHVAKTKAYPQTLHYRGDGVFMISGENTRKYRRLFKAEML